jgi:hypothetical protein
VSDRYKEMWEDAFHDNLEKKAEISELKAENARLKAEVERLIKMCQATSPDGFIHIRDIKHLNAAKGGKQP